MQFALIEKKTAWTYQTLNLISDLQVAMKMKFFNCKHCDQKRLTMEEIEEHQNVTHGTMIAENDTKILEKEGPLQEESPKNIASYKKGSSLSKNHPITALASGNKTMIISLF